MDKHKLDEINQRVELASDPSRADPRQPGKNSFNLNFKPFATLTIINIKVMSRHLIVFPKIPQVASSLANVRQKPHQQRPQQQNGARQLRSQQSTQRGEQDRPRMTTHHSFNSALRRSRATAFGEYFLAARNHGSRTGFRRARGWGIYSNSRILSKVGITI